ncbi:hypothetical protein BS47DRAFT_1401693 [Hydnum rufescens UP504]|uniref:Uncharacterized protein n=1 Tax=Hydnum rufescens UP504 TaxID=1448309 RepID=A0A9P6AFB9_9AGAM|nr:hypothetical protein BS47DRAFT_1401693 [Hydnum rufescens UP504]
MFALYQAPSLLSRRVFCALVSIANFVDLRHSVFKAVFNSFLLSDGKNPAAQRPWDISDSTNNIVMKRKLHVHLLWAKSRVKTYQKHRPNPHEWQEPERHRSSAAPSDANRKKELDPHRVLWRVSVLESPTRPSSSNASMDILSLTLTLHLRYPHAYPHSSPSPIETLDFRPIPNIPHVPKQDPEAAEVAEASKA